jgi:nitrogen fixation/metabolism regulation signal transduction histidine kinase
MADEKNRRHTMLIEPELQLWSLIVPLVVVISTSAFLFLLLAVQAHTLSGVLERTLEQPVSEQVERAHVFFGILVAVVLLLHIGMIFWIGLKASHRFAGPIYRIKKTMQQIAEGERGLRITLRENDKLKDVAAEFNRMMDSLEGEHSAPLQRDTEPEEGEEPAEEAEVPSPEEEDEG